MSKLARAIDEIESHAVTSGEIIGRLEATLGSLNLLDLYSKYFPKEFAEVRLRWSDHNSVIKACGRFVELVDLRLFPVRSPTWEFEEAGNLELQEILPYAPFPGWWETDYFGEISPLQRVILQSVGEINQDGESLRYHGGIRSRLLDEEALEAAVGQKRAPLKYLTTAIRFTVKGTGNLWCDITEEEVGYASDFPEWNEKTIEWLTEEWKKAREIYGKFKHLEAWMLEQPSQREKTIRKLIEKAMKPVAGPGEGRPLCETLAEYVDREEDNDDDVEE